MLIRPTTDYWRSYLSGVYQKVFINRLGLVLKRLTEARARGRQVVRLYLRICPTIVVSPVATTHEFRDAAFLTPQTFRDKSLRLGKCQEHEAREPIPLREDGARLMHAGDAGQVCELRQVESGDEKRVQIFFERAVVMVRLDTGCPETKVGNYRI